MYVFHFHSGNEFLHIVFFHVKDHRLVISGIQGNTIAAESFEPDHSGVRMMLSVMPIVQVEFETCFVRSKKGPLIAIYNQGNDKNNTGQINYHISHSIIDQERLKCRQEGEQKHIVGGPGCGMFFYLEGSHSSILRRKS